MITRTSRAPRCVAIAIAGLACAVFALCASSALAARGHVFGYSFGSKGTGQEQFEEPTGIAVNEATGDVYVLDRGNSRVDHFTSTGTYLGEFNGETSPTGKFTRPIGITVDNSCVLRKLSEPACKETDPSNGDVYVADGYKTISSSPVGVVDKFAPTGEYLGQIEVPNDGNITLQGVAVDAKGDLWVTSIQADEYIDKFTNEAVNKYITTVKPSQSIGFAPGLAVDSVEGLYALTTGPGYFGDTEDAELKRVATKFDDGGKVLISPFDNDAATEARRASGLAVEAGTNDVYVDTVTAVRRYGSDGSPLESFGGGHLANGVCGYVTVNGKVGVSAEACYGGVAVDARTGEVFVTDPVANEVKVFVLEPPGAPTVQAESVSDVTADSTTLQAEINPRGADAEYRFEYGQCSSEAACPVSGYERSVPAPDGFVGGDFEVHGVAVHLQGLRSGTAYHFRPVVHNAYGEATGEEKLITTQPVGVFGLPDGRGWELVSPPDKRDAAFWSIGATAPIQAAANGGAVTYAARGPSGLEAAGYTNGAQLFSTRSGSGWSSSEIGIAHEQVTGQSIGEGEEYRFFSTDLSRGVVQPFGSFDPNISGQASEQTAFVRDDFAAAGGACSSGCYRPLVSGESGFANVPEGVKFGEEGKCPTVHLICGPFAIGASEDLKHIVFQSLVGLTEPPGDKGGLYEWSDGALQLVSVLPDGTPATPATSQTLGRNDTLTRHAVSADGRRVVWSENTSNGVHLYLRDLGDGETAGETVQLDTGLAVNSGQEFQGASVDVSRVFFKDAGDLYMYDVASKERTRLTVGANIRGAISGISADGSYLYFVANGKLAGGAIEGNCAGGSAATDCNLYELHETGNNEWQVKLVAVLSGADEPDFWDEPAGLTARVAPDGQWFAFMSQRSLTGYDNRDAVTGMPDEEVYLYDANTGELACASCNPTGARPDGLARGQIELAGGGRVWPFQQGIAANIPGWSPYTGSLVLYQSRYLSDNGRLFFNSSDVLVPTDVNGQEDVYEYEPPGVGGCTEANVMFSARSHGCVGLISSGTSAEESAFLDASETGGDVFFLTTAKLVGADYDSALDVYDAHECTAGSPCTPQGDALPPACTTEASCRPAPSSQPAVFGAPASSTFSGIGNVGAQVNGDPTPRALMRARELRQALRSCARQHARRKRRACERRAHGRFGKQATTTAGKSGGRG